VIISNVDVISGRHLTFRYLAYNVHGWSEPSDEFVIVAATIPAVPTDAKSESTFVESYLILSWKEPTFTGGDLVAIEEYRIQVQTNDGVTFVDVPAGCDPHLPAVVSAQ